MPIIWCDSFEDKEPGLLDTPVSAWIQPNGPFYGANALKQAKSSGEPIWAHS